MNTYEGIIQKLTERAWKDEAFKKRLFADPRAVLREMGYNVPDSVEIAIYEDTPSKVNLVMPPNPVNMKLSEEQLDRISGGTGTDSTSRYSCCAQFDVPYPC